MPALTRPSPDLPPRRAGVSDRARHRRDVASRSLAAVGGGYLLANIFVPAFARIVPMAPRDASQLALMLSFIVFALAVILAFAAKGAGRAWGWILGLSAVLALIVGLVPGGTA